MARFGLQAAWRRAGHGLASAAASSLGAAKSGAPPAGTSAPRARKGPEGPEKPFSRAREVPSRAPDGPARLQREAADRQCARH